MSFNLLLRRSFRLSLSPQVSKGFTLTEVISVVSVISITSAIAVPSWLAFISRQRLRTSITQVYWAMQTARSNARAQRISWQASFRQQDGVSQWVIHPANVPPANLSDAAWSNLASGVEIDDQQANGRGKLETTLPKVNPATNQVKQSGSVYRVVFNYKACPVYNPTDECTQTSLRAKGRIGLRHQYLPKQKRCVIVSTVLGAIRLGQDSTATSSSKYDCN